MLRILVLFSKKQFEGDHQYGKVVDDDKLTILSESDILGKGCLLKELPIKRMGGSGEKFKHMNNQLDWFPLKEHLHPYKQMHSY